MDGPLNILVAEDDMGDILLLRRAFMKAGVRQPVYFAQDGQEVIDYLSGHPPFTNPIKYPLPQLLLLDLKLPQIDGFQVLEWLRRQPALKHVLVIVLSASGHPRDVERAYSLGANSYLVKPQDPQDLVMMVQRIEQYWMELNVAPSASLESILAPGS
jgi:CheY-like chemotaxis protein